MAAQKPIKLPIAQAEYWQIHIWVYFTKSELGLNAEPH